MTKQDIQVTVYKQEQGSSYPDHILVKKNSTNEKAHLFFDEGELRKVVYTTYIPAATRDKVTMVYQVQAGQLQAMEPFVESDMPRDAFFIHTISRLNNKRALLFFDKDLNVAVSVCTDFNGKSLPDGGYLKNQLATVEEKYSLVPNQSKSPLNRQKERD